MFSFYHETEKMFFIISDKMKPELCVLSKKQTVILFQFQGEKKVPWLHGGRKLCPGYSDCGLNKDGPCAK
jgi:hypothetical protein